MGLKKAKDWTRTITKITGIKKILEADFGSRNYIFAKKKPLINNSEKAEYKG